MNPIMLIGMVAVGITILGSFVAVSNDQATQIDSSSKLVEKQHARVVEASSLKAITNTNGGISIENLANINAEILEIRVLDNQGKVIMKKTLSKPIPSSRIAEMVVDNEIKTYIDNIKTR